MVTAVNGKSIAGHEPRTSPLAKIKGEPGSEVTLTRAAPVHEGDQGLRPRAP